MCLTVELFAGIGGFRLAADECGFRTVWANDMNPKSCAVYRDCFGDAELREGDIRSLWEQIPPHDLLTAGFPCQPFSSAGKKKGLRDPRGHLFQVILDVLDQHRPPYFILENVKRLLSMEKGAHFATILAALTKLGYQVEWRLLNASHFGLPQNRQRVFMLGTRCDQLEIRLASKAELREVLQQQFYALTDCTQWMRIENHRQKFPFWGIARSGQFFAENLARFCNPQPIKPLSTMLQLDAGQKFDYTESTLERIKESVFVNRFVDGVQILYNQAGGARMGYTVFGVEGIAPTLTATTSRHYERYFINDKYRRLTNIEYARLQGFPDNHCQAVSVYHQYALYGNAVPPPMASWVMGVVRRVRLGAIPK